MERIEIQDKVIDILAFYASKSRGQIAPMDFIEADLEIDDILMESVVIEVNVTLDVDIVSEVEGIGTVEELVDVIEAKLAE